MLRDDHGIRIYQAAFPETYGHSRNLDQGSFSAQFAAAELPKVTSCASQAHTPGSGSHTCTEGQRHAEKGRLLQVFSREAIDLIIPMFSKPQILFSIHCRRRCCGLLLPPYIMNALSPVSKRVRRAWADPGGRSFSVFGSFDCSSYRAFGKGHSRYFSSV